MNASKYLFQNDNAADRVTLVGVVVNLLLSVGKGVVGITCNSSALVADAGHSLSDLFSDFITLWAVQIARLPPDDDVSFVVSFIGVFFTCRVFMLGYSCCNNIFFYMRWNEYYGCLSYFEKCTNSYSYSFFIFTTYV